MSDVTGTSRRKFIGTAGAAAAVAGVATATRGFASTGASTPATPLATAVVVTVVDPLKGVFNVMHGEHEVQITDKAFASRIASAIA